MVQRRGFITHHSPSITGPSITFFSAGSLPACSPCGVSPTDPLPPSVSPSSLRSLPPVLQRTLLPVPPQICRPKVLLSCPCVRIKSCRKRKPPPPWSPAFSCCRGECGASRKPAAPQRAALMEAESWRGEDIRTSLPGRKSEALNSRIRDRGFALISLRNL